MDTKKDFTKLPLSIEQQISLLLKRGLIIPNENHAVFCLRTVGYYRLSAYFKPFQADHLGTFKLNTSFTDIWHVYTFDRELRLHVTDALERIEVALRAPLANVLSQKYGALWYLADSPFNKGWFKANPRTKKTPRGVFNNEIFELCRKRQEEPIKHYYNKYHNPEYPPSWMMLECLSFGKCINLFRYLRMIEDKKAICQEFEYHPTVIESLLEPLRYTRNMCAHHSRLWNRWFVVRPKHITAFDGLVCKPHSFCEQAFIIAHLIHKISPGSHWKQRLFTLFEKYPQIPFELMGFQNDWTNDPFWEKTP